LEGHDGLLQSGDNQRTFSTFESWDLRHAKSTMSNHLFLWVSVLWGLSLLSVFVTWGNAFLRGWRFRHWHPFEFRLSGQPFVSVLVPAWNEKNTLTDTLLELHNSDYPDWEAIVIAGGGDGTQEIAREVCAGWSNFRVLAQKPNGKNAALNQGLAQAKGEFIVMLDADTLVDPQWLKQLIAPLTQDCAASSNNYTPLIRTWVSMMFEMEKLSAYCVHQENTLRGCGIAIKRDVLEKLGGLPESVTAGVDWDLDQRLQSQGLRRVFIFQAISRTPLPYTLALYWHNQVRWRRAHLRISFSFHKLSALLFYGVGIAFFAIPFLAIGLNLSAPGVWQIWPIFWTWVFLRRLGLSIEVISSNGFAWFRHAWIPLVLLPIDLASGIVALVTVGRKAIIFRGSRRRAADK
jgi:cellulose synthase/poly-beta-1,6-N-acetylglucosamine synthase-like glycosyltransferase